MLVLSNVRTTYPKLSAFVYGDLSKVPTSKPRVWRAFRKWSELGFSEALTALTTCSKPYIDVKVMPGVFGRFRGSTDPHTILVSEHWAKRFESDHAKPAAKLLMEATILHEMVHWGDWKDGVDQDPEEGNEFEKEAYGKVIGRYW